MKSDLFHSAGQTPEVDSVQVVALYNPDSGQIAHTHMVTVFAGGRPVPEEEAIEAAQRHAARLRHPVQALRVKLSSNPEHAQRSHRIDPETGEFIRLPGPDFEQRQPSAAT